MITIGLLILLTTYDSWEGWTIRLSPPRQDLYDLAGSSFPPGTVFKLLLEEPSSCRGWISLEWTSWSIKKKIECKGLQIFKFKFETKSNRTWGWVKTYDIWITLRIFIKNTWELKHQNNRRGFLDGSKPTDFHFGGWTIQKFQLFRFVLFLYLFYDKRETKINCILYIYIFSSRDTPCYLLKVSDDDNDNNFIIYHLHMISDDISIYLSLIFMPFHSRCVDHRRSCCRGTRISRWNARRLPWCWISPPAWLSGPTPFWFGIFVKENRKPESSRKPLVSWW